MIPFLTESGLWATHMQASGTPINIYSRVLNNAAANAYSRMKIAAVFSCCSAASDPTYGIIAKRFFDKGAKCTLGFTTTIPQPETTLYITTFCEFLGRGYTFWYAVDQAKKKAASEHGGLGDLYNSYHYGDNNTRL